ncbi:uncharacterized mitochondrial protein AtMg00310-like [Juglans microcarpa x Juglans regia]|uniref:uncharacterized mitochondrial protein AtMg00310-like n=1 Tax=Juglans microcarpa x Juglans regia TaxID=2249226 RepID=UPI001B7E9C91|nr:uncharacterized mitochondrial protein AtMg00310-like [Juglans microcarpa x Juglans regia]
MSVFKIPRKLSQEISSMLAKFRWGCNLETRGVHWKSWGFMGRSKGDGGMGFREIEHFNLALLAKHDWRFLQDPLSLVGRVYRSKYFRETNILDAKLGASPSLIWMSVWLATDRLKEGLRWRVGNGKKINVWGQKWLPKPTTYCVQSSGVSLRREAKVSNLMIEELNIWNDEPIKENFDKEEAEMICKMPIGSINAKDKLIWNFSKYGKFTVRNGDITWLNQERKW